MKTYYAPSGGQAPVMITSLLELRLYNRQTRQMMERLPKPLTKKDHQDREKLANYFMIEALKREVEFCKR